MDEIRLKDNELPKFIWLILAIFVLIGIGMLIAASKEYYEYRQMRKTGIEITGVVADIIIHKTDNSTLYKLIVDYYVEEVRYTYSPHTDTNIMNYKIGDPFELIYNPNNPSVSMPLKMLDNNFIFFAFLGMMFALGPSIFYITQKSPKNKVGNAQPIRLVDFLLPIVIPLFLIIMMVFFIDNLFITDIKEYGFFEYLKLNTGPVIMAVFITLSGIILFLTNIYRFIKYSCGKEEETFAVLNTIQSYMEYIRNMKAESIKVLTGAYHVLTFIDKNGNYYVYPTKEKEKFSINETYLIKYVIDQVIDINDANFELNDINSPVRRKSNFNFFLNMYFPGGMHFRGIALLPYIYISYFSSLIAIITTWEITKTDLYIAIVTLAFILSFTYYIFYDIVYKIKYRHDLNREADY
jgi:hypothetical protein